MGKVGTKLSKIDFPASGKKVKCQTNNNSFLCLFNDMAFQNVFSSEIIRYLAIKQAFGGVLESEEGYLNS